MEAAARQHHANSSRVVFEDGLGQRVPVSDSQTGSERHALVLRAVLATAPSFEFALRERVERLAAFQHPQIARVVGMERRSGDVPELRVVFEGAGGIRLSDLLRGSQLRQVPVGINAALCAVRQLAPAIAALQQSAPELSHGALGPERLVVTPDARLVVVDHVFGSALEQLRHSRERYWNELRIALPVGAPSPRLDQRADVLQLGLVALALILGRPIRLEEFPSRIPDILASTSAVSPEGGFEPLPAGVRGWLARSLQIGPERPFATVAEARDAFDAVLGNAELVAAPATLSAFLARYRAADRAETAAAEPGRTGSTPSGSPPVRRALPATSAPPPLELVAAQTAQSGSRSADVLALAAPVASRRAGTLGVPQVVRRPAFPSEPLEDDGDNETWTAHLDADAGTRHWWWNWRLVGTFVLLGGIVGASGSLGAARQLLQLVDTGHGTLELTSMPAGAEVLVDGDHRGATPLALSLSTGTHDIELRAGRARRTFGVVIGRGEKVTQFVKLPRSAVPRRAKPPARPQVASPADATNGTSSPRTEARSRTDASRFNDGPIEATLLPVAPPPQPPAGTPR